jgi:hypothetical protein
MARTVTVETCIVYQALVRDLSYYLPSSRSGVVSVRKQWNSVVFPHVFSRSSSQRYRNTGPRSTIADKWWAHKPFLVIIWKVHCQLFISTNQMTRKTTTQETVENSSVGPCLCEFVRWLRLQQEGLSNVFSVALWKFRLGLNRYSVYYTLCLPITHTHASSLYYFRNSSFLVRGILDCVWQGTARFSVCRLLIWAAVYTYNIPFAITM